MPSEARIKFFYTKPVSLRDRTGLKSFLLKIFKKEGRPLSGLNYVFCNDSELLKINQDFLSHNDYTDIISFELSVPGEPLNGEIYISVDRVRENARKMGETYKKELHRVIFHGALHLCGYKDKTSTDQKTMRKMEDFYLDRYF